MNECQLHFLLEVACNKSWLANVILVHISPVQGFSSLPTATSNSSQGYSSSSTTTTTTTTTADNTYILGT